MKKCTKCNTLKKNTEFSYHKVTKDNLYNQCKLCRQIQRRIRELERPESDFTGNKICKRCKQNKPKVNFTTNKSTKDGLNSSCKQCIKDSSLLKKYGISLNGYNALLKSQGFRCALCGTNKPLGVSGMFVVDHCHKTGVVRGLLCNHCNTGLGKLGDNVETLQRAVDYLKLSSGKITL